MGEWRDTSLGRVVQLQRGHDLPEEDRHAGTVPIMGSFGVTGWHNLPRANGPGVTIGRSGASIGVVSFVESDYWPLNTCLYVTDFLGNDPRFCYYWLKTLDLASYNSGSAQPSLNRNYIYEMPVRIPSDNAEQKVIAHILGTLDDKIQLNRRMNETLEAMARAIFKSWFVDFDPVRAKAEGRDPGLPKHIANLFPDRFQDSELGEIPAGWEAATLESLASIEGGKQLPTEECNPHGTFPVYGANGIMGFAERATHNGLVIAFGRVGAYCGSVHWTYGGAWINNNASSIVPRHWPEYVLQVMLTADFEGMRTGSAQPFIPNSSLASMLVIRPSEEVLDRFCSTVAPVRLREQSTAAESRALAALRDTLLPKLMSGALPVPDQIKRQHSQR